MTEIENPEPEVEPTPSVVITVSRDRRDLEVLTIGDVRPTEVVGILETAVALYRRASNLPPLGT